MTVFGISATVGKWAMSLLIVWAVLLFMAKIPPAHDFAVLFAWLIAFAAVSANIQLSPASGQAGTGAT